MKNLGRIAMAALAVLAVGSLALASEMQVAQGKVKTLSGKTLILAGEDGVDWVFEISEGAVVVATGATHKSDALAAAGKKPVIDDFVRENHYVTVQYLEENGTRYIKKLRVH
jgi:hypothetical protein